MTIKIDKQPQIYYNYNVFGAVFGFDRIYLVLFAGGRCPKQQKVKITDNTKFNTALAFA